jgi:hypothetical protein
VCPPVDTAVRYTTRYTLHVYEDNEQYLVLQDYTLDMAPNDVAVDLGNLFNGNKVLGKLTVAYCKIWQQQRLNTDNVSVCLFQVVK